MNAVRVALFAVAVLVLLAGPGCVHTFMAADTIGDGPAPRIDAVSYAVNIRDGLIWDTIWILGAGVGLLFHLWDLLFLLGVVGTRPTPHAP